MSLLQAEEEGDLFEEEKRAHGKDVKRLRIRG